MDRNFIISSLCTVAEDVPALDENPIPSDELATVAERLIVQHRRFGVIDLSRFFTALHRELFEVELSPVARGVALARALDQLEGSEWISVAAELGHGLHAAQLRSIGSAGLLAMARALRAGCPERCERALERVNLALAERATVEVSDADGLWVVTQGFGLCEEAGRRAVTEALPTLKGRLGGSVVIAVPAEEANTSRGMWVEHYRRCAELVSSDGLAMLERAARFGRVVLIPQEQLLPARAMSLAERAAAAFAHAAAALGHVRQRIFEPAEAG